MADLKLALPQGRLYLVFARCYSARETRELVSPIFTYTAADALTAGELALKASGYSEGRLTGVRAPNQWEYDYAKEQMRMSAMGQMTTAIWLQASDLPYGG